MYKERIVERRNVLPLPKNRMHGSIFSVQVKMQKKVEKTISQTHSHIHVLNENEEKKM